MRTVRGTCLPRSIVPSTIFGGGGGRGRTSVTQGVTQNRSKGWERGNDQRACLTAEQQRSVLQEVWRACARRDVFDVRSIKRLFEERLSSRHYQQTKGSDGTRESPPLQ